MKIVAQSQLRINTGLHLRAKPDTRADTRAGLQPGVIVVAIAPPTNGWLRCVVRGYEHADHAGYVFSEASADSSIKARRGGGLGWRSVEYTGYVSLANPAWYTVLDGPQ